MKVQIKAAIALAMVIAAGYAHAQTCSGMSLGNNASLNGYVPFPSANAWNTNIASAPVDPNSPAITAAPGFTGLHLHHDFGSTSTGYGIPYVVVDSTTTPTVPINVIDYASESDVVVAPYPANTPIEGAPADCSGWPDAYLGDTHALVLDRATCFLYETFQTNRCNGLYNAANETIWDMKNYESRPYGWTSADAAGLAVFPGLVRYDEVAAGAIHHAIRFTMQQTKNDANDGYFVEPASHAAGTSWGVSNVMGMRIRLKAGFDISGFSAANQVILTAMKQYGMILADNGGYFYFQGAPDPRWNDDDLTNLDAIGSENFEVVEMTPEFPGWDSATAPTGVAPVINSFTASALSVSSGSPVTFTYNISGDSYDYIDMIGPVTAGSGSVTIKPTATQTYTLYSMNQYGDNGSGIGYGESVGTPITVTVPGSVVAPPVFTPPAGTYYGVTTVTISTATSPYAQIYYTTDGTTPTYPITGTTKAYPVTPTPPNSQGVVNSITVSASETLKAIAVVSGYPSPSAVGSAAFTIPPAAATPSFSPTPGTYTTVPTVTISSTTPNSTIYYTTDGSTPTYPTTGTTAQYTAPITLNDESGTQTLNAIAIASNHITSAVGTGVYTLNLPTVAMPTFSPAAGAYSSAKTVKISDSTHGAAIYYTTDGTTPTYPMTGTTQQYTAQITVSASETVEAIGILSGDVESPVGLAVYTIGTVTAPACSAISLGDDASLNGFVPFPATNAWNTNIVSAPVDPNSEAIVAASGFAGEHLHHDFGSTATGYGIPYVVVDSAATTAVPINVIDYANQSDVVVAPYPAHTPIEGELADCSGWPDTYNGDAHALVLDRAKCVLYETFNTNRCNGLYNASSETLWDLKNSESRPYGWTSADAAGLPIFPGLVRYDEVASGAIHHAIRFTLPATKDDANDGYFVEPATHAAGVYWGVSNVMGMRIRLKANFDISSYSPANQIILTAMKQYGMILADNGGYFFFQGAPDPRWNDDDLTNLDTIGSGNFEVVQMTPEFPGWDSASAPTGAVPVINSFTASASSVSSGSPVTFTYSASGDSYDFIDMIGPVAAGSGSVTISPTATQTYTLYSTNAYGQTVSTPITVTVPGSVAAPPVFTPPAGLYTSALAVTLSTPTSPYAAIYYTTDGTTPTYPITGTTMAYPVTPTPPNNQGTVNSITVSATETLKAIAIVAGYPSASAMSSATYTFVASAAATPTFSVTSGTYTSAQTVKISTTTQNATIYYTTDGSDPANSSTAIKYLSAITVSASETINAVAEASGYANSVVASSAYNIYLPAATPTFLPPAGTYPAAQSVAISSTTPYAVIYYTTDGSDPATSATAVRYTAVVGVPKTETLNAVAEAGGYSNSPAGSAAYTLTLPLAATPTFNPVAGTYTSAQSVTISTLTPNSTIYYTTDGSDPATSSTAAVYANPVPISPAAGTYSKQETLNAVAEAAGFNNSVAGSAAYTINLPFFGPHFVQQCSQQAPYTTTVTCTLNGVGAGDTLVIGILGVPSATVTSSSGTPALAVQDGSVLSAYILPNTTAGSIAVTASVAANTTYWLSVFEYSNTAASPLDGTAYAVSTTWQPTSLSTPNFTTASGLDVLWSYCIAPGGYTLALGSAPVAWSALTGPSSGYATLIEQGQTTLAGTYYGQCAFPSGAAIPEIITLALKPPQSGPQTITFPAITAAQYALTTLPLSATASSGLAVSFTSSTPTICTVSGTTASLLTPGTCILHAAQTGNSNYSAAPTVSQGFYVHPAQQTITFPTITGARYALSQVTLAATSSSGLAVSFATTTPTVCTVSGSTASLLIGGSCILQATQAGNALYGAALPVTQVLVVHLAHQSITFTPITTTQYALSQLMLSASASSGLPVTLSSATPTVCTLSGNTASLLIAGTCDIHATQAGNATYAVAPLIAYDIDVHPIIQTITFPIITGPNYPLTKVTLSATATSGLTVSFASITPTVCTVSGKTASLLIAGNCYLHAVQTGNPDYAAAPIVTQQVYVTPLSQTISFPTITGTQYAASQLTLNATASSGLTVAFNSTTPTVCTVAAKTASLLTSGTCILQATQAGSSIYAAAPLVPQSVVAHLAPQTITFPAVGGQTVGSNLPLAATASSGLTIAFFSATTSVCTVSGTTATMLTTGTCVIHATQAGNSTYSAAPLVSQSITVKAN